MSLYITCPQCKKNGVWMAHFFAEYLCKECLKTETKSLKQRRHESFLYEEELRKITSKQKG